MKFPVLFLLLVAGLASCQPERVSKPCPEGPYADVVQAQNKLALALLKPLHNEKPAENLFMSPASIGTALAMLYNGADGATRSQMDQAMQLGGLPLETLNAQSQRMICRMNQPNDYVRLRMANAIWYRKGFQIFPSFLDSASTRYEAQVNAADFGDPATLNAVNKWASDHTEKKIPKVLDKIESDDVMFLLNAIYFKGDWLSAFDKSKTRNETFTLQNGNTVNCDMMRQTHTFPAYFGPDASVLELPYGKQGKDSSYSMVLVLPVNQSLDALISQLDLNTWNTWMTNLSVQQVEAGLPKTEIKYSHTLNEALKALGMEDAFVDGLANFARMTEAPVYVSFVKHDSYLRIDEAGSEAAAVTTIGVVVTSLPPPPPQFIVDRPCLMFIRDRSTGQLLFVGKLMNPS